MLLLLERWDFLITSVSRDLLRLLQEVLVGLRFGRLLPLLLLAVLLLHGRWSWEMGKILLLVDALVDG